MKEKKQKDKQPACIEELYTCSVCGRENLKFEEIIYKEDAEEQIIPSSVTCETCGLIAMWPTFKSMIKPGREKDAEKLFKKMAEGLKRNHNRTRV